MRRRVVAHEHAVLCEGIDKKIRTERRLSSQCRCPCAASIKIEPFDYVILVDIEMLDPLYDASPIVVRHTVAQSRRQGKRCGIAHTVERLDRASNLALDDSLEITVRPRVLRRARFQSRHLLEKHAQSRRRGHLGDPIENKM